MMYTSNVYFLIKSWNSFQYFDRCINSVFNQKNSGYRILFVDDCSDYNASQKKYIQKKLVNHICVFNRERKFATRNAYEIINRYVLGDEDIIINLDADDWLLSSDTVNIINQTYEDHNCLFTYGNCRKFDGKKLLDDSASSLKPTNSRYDRKTEIRNTFRLDHFRPNHLRSWKKKIFVKIKKNSLLCENKKTWIRFNEDLAIFFPMLEMANGNYQVIEKSLYAYNCANPLNDKKIHIKEKLVEEVFLRKQAPYEIKI